jgi:hypothetical protein
MAKNWIKGAIKHPGALHKEMGIPEGEKIPAGKLAKAAQAGGKLGQRARLAETLEHMHHGGKAGGRSHEDNRERGPKEVGGDRSGQHPHGEPATASGRHSFHKITHPNHGEKMNEG